MPGNEMFLLLVVLLLFIAVGRTLGKTGQRKTHLPEPRNKVDVRYERTISDKRLDQFHDEMDFTFGRGRYARNRAYAQERGESGRPRWTEPFAPVDMFGRPTVFSKNFKNPRRR